MWAVARKNEAKLRETKKHENTSNESDFIENKIPDLNSYKRIQHRCFPMKFTKSLRTPFLTEHPYVNSVNQWRHTL